MRYQRLPVTQWSLYLCCWGLTLILTASLLVGGLGHFFKYLPGRDGGQSYHPTAQKPPDE